MPSITFNVCGVAEVPRFAQAGITDIVSIGDGVLDPDLSWFDPPPRVHRFTFIDVCHDCEAGPQRDHAQRLINLADSFLRRGSDVRVLYHCAAGVSRSTASLFILLVRGGMGYQQAYDAILGLRRHIAPNLLLIKYADAIMGYGGKMLDYVAERRGPDGISWVKVNADRA